MRKVRSGRAISTTSTGRRRPRLVLPAAAEWCRSIRWVVLVYTVLVGLALTGSFVSYDAVIAKGHPWLPNHYCPGCPLCGMTRSFCAMSSGLWEQAWQWNRGGPALYITFWVWLLGASIYFGRTVRRFLTNQISFAIGIGLVLLTFGSCSFHQSSLIRLVPIESCAVMTVDWSEIREDRSLRRVLNGDEFEKLLHRLGMTSESVNTMALFTTLANEPVAGLLLKGSFHTDEITAELEHSGWTKTNLDGHQVYVHGRDYVALPADNVVFAGTREGALAMFRASESAAESIVTSDAYKRINRTISIKDKPVKAFLFVSQGTIDMADAALTATSVALSLFNLGGVGQLLQTINVARGFALSLDQSAGEEYPVEVCVLLRDEDAAAFVSGSLNALKTISELAASSDRDRENLRALRQMRIIRNHEVLAVKIEIPATTLFPTSPADR